LDDDITVTDRALNLIGEELSIRIVNDNNVADLNNTFSDNAAINSVNANYSYGASNRSSVCIFRAYITRLIVVTFLAGGIFDSKAEKFNVIANRACSNGNFKIFTRDSCCADAVNLNLLGRRGGESQNSYE
jgi:hypothetical protein